MIHVLLLAGWSLSGVAIAALLTPEPGNRFGWAPMAVILGPLWAAVAVEQRLTRQPVPARSQQRRTRTTGMAARPPRMDVGAHPLAMPVGLECRTA